MPKFVTFFSYTADTWARMIASPGDRTAVVRATVGAVGGSVESLHWMLGAHDGMLVFEVPDSASAAAISTTIVSSGSFRAAETHELFTQEQLTALLGKADLAKSTYRTPGS